MTPAERDEARAWASIMLMRAEAVADRAPDAEGEPSDFDAPFMSMCRAVLRYVPAGDVAGISVIIDGDSAVIDLSEGIAYSPAGARSLAHELHAAADAAEETTR